MADKQTYSFPVSNGNVAGNLNCIVLPPTLGRAKSFRAKRRAWFDNAQAFNALSERRTALLKEIIENGLAADSAEQQEHDAISARLDQMDTDSFQNLIEQGKSILQVVSFTPTQGQAQPEARPTLDDVDWDAVDATLLNGATGFFATSINA